LTDVFGVSGPRMLEALLQGQAKPEEMALSVDPMRFLEEQIEELDQDIAAKIQQAGPEPQWQLLQSVPGIQQTSAAAILAETGTDMRQFPSEKHISSWAGICPGNNRSAGKNRSSHTTGGNPWL